ncbi:spore coat protein [Priestia megaterium]|uniref:spore coat protein n=1 Tax=Priestia megaterium TaxID=1404 RepID=UPI00203C40A6|nr:spore coat protein [Priestia megaterium]MCM3197177.1 spore coat protein [Priestia megaterium]
MTDPSKNSSGVPNKLVELLVSDILRKNGVNTEKIKKSLSNEQKQALKELVEDLSQQVDSFINKSSSKTTDSN